MEANKDKTAVEKWQEYFNDKDGEMRESHKFIIESARKYEPFTHGGLNQLPYVLMPAVAICMEEYSNTQNASLKEENRKLTDDLLEETGKCMKYQHEIERLKEENNRLTDCVDKMISGENYLYVTNSLKEDLQKLKEENKRLNIELSNYAYQIDRAKRDRDKAEEENERLKAACKMAAIEIEKGTADQLTVNVLKSALSPS
jgi:hypothetical protein